MLKKLLESQELKSCFHWPIEMNWRIWFTVMKNRLFFIRYLTKKKKKKSESLGYQKSKAGYGDSICCHHLRCVDRDIKINANIIGKIFLN